jgi:hypothetical protein
VSKNFAVSTIAGTAPGAAGTTFTVESGHGARFLAGPAVVFPAGTVPSPATAEVVTLPSPSGDTFTGVVRAVESSSARTIVVGDQIVQGITAAMWDGLVSTVAGKLDAATASGTYAPLVHGHVQSDVTGLAAALAAKAPLADPAFTGNPTAPTPSPGDNDTSVATTAFVTAAVSTSVASLNVFNAANFR